MTHAEQAAALLQRAEDGGPGSSGGRKLEERQMIATAAVAHAILAAAEATQDQTTATLVQHANDARSVCDALAAVRMAVNSLTEMVETAGLGIDTELHLMRDTLELGGD